MTPEDIVRMARAVGASAFDQTVVFTYDEAERFAALVAAAEREACERVADGLWKWNASAREVAAAIRAKGEG